METPAKPLKITALTVAETARVLSSASGRKISEEDVRTIAEDGGLLSPDGEINLIEYAAFLIQEMACGTD